MEQTYIIPVKTKHYRYANVDSIGNCPLAKAIRDIIPNLDIKIRVMPSYVKFIFPNGDEHYFKMEGWHECTPQTYYSSFNDRENCTSRLRFIEEYIVMVEGGHQIDTINVTLTKYKSFLELLNYLYSE